MARAKLDELYFVLWDASGKPLIACETKDDAEMWGGIYKWAGIAVTATLEVLTRDPAEAKPDSRIPMICSGHNVSLCGR